MTGSFSWHDWIDHQLSQLDATHLRRRLVNRDGPAAGELVIDGQRFVNFSSNDYLGLASDSRLVAAVRQSIKEYGWGSGASSLVTGHSTLHHQLERALANWESREAAILFPTGYAANVGTITALADKQTIIFSDANNHASIIDGCRLSGAQVQIYRHGDADDLAQRMDHIDSSSSEHKLLIVTDGVFSMDGDVAPLVELTRLAERHNALLIVDEAHATGVLGERGCGSCEWCGVDSPQIVKVGTLSKALGSVGGFVAATQPIIDWLTNRARTLIYSTATPPAVAAAALTALNVIQNEPERMRHVLGLADQMRRLASEMGLDTGNSTTHIVPVIIGDPEHTMKIAERLKHAGFLVPGIRPPSVAPGRSLLRFSMHHDHTAESIDSLMKQLAITLR